MSVEKRGVVLEYREGLVTVLTPQGEFLNIPWTKTPSPEIGSEISFKEPAVPQTGLRFTGLAAIAACLLLVFVSVSLWSGALLPDSRQVVAYVNVDINPSIELGLNKEGKVVKSVGLNSDGQLLLQKLALQDLTVDQAVELITQAAVENNYISAEKENTVLITVSEPHRVPEEVRKLEEKVEAKLEANQITATTQVLEVSKDIRNKAKKLGVSPGKYIVLLEAVDEGLELSVEDIKDDSVVKAIKKAGGVPRQIISKARQDKHDYKELEKRAEEKLKKIAERRSVQEGKRPVALGEKQDKNDGEDGENSELSRDEVKNLKDGRDNNPGKRGPLNKNNKGGLIEERKGQTDSPADREEENRKKADIEEDWGSQDNGYQSDNKNSTKDSGKPWKEKGRSNEKDNEKDKESGNNINEETDNDQSVQDQDNSQDKDSEDENQDKAAEEAGEKKRQKQENLQEYPKRFWQWWNKNE